MEGQIHSVSFISNSWSIQLLNEIYYLNKFSNFNLPTGKIALNRCLYKRLSVYLILILQKIATKVNIEVLNFQECGALPTCESDSSLALSKIPNNYMQEINETIKLQSQDTAVIFLRLSTPTFQNNQERLRMYELLKLQSDNLPPVIYVHGIKSVVSISV